MFGHIDEFIWLLLFPRIAPPSSASLDTNDAVPRLLKTLWRYRSMAPDKENMYEKSCRLRSTRIKHGGDKAQPSRGRNHWRGHGWQYLPPEPPAWLLKKETLPSLLTFSSLLPSTYSAPLWGGKHKTKHAKSVQESPSVAWILTMGMGDLGSHSQVGILL